MRGVEVAFRVTASPDCALVADFVGIVHYRIGNSTHLCVCFGKVKSEARSNQLITFARCLREALPIQDRDLPSAPRNQTGTFQFPGSIRDRWPLNTQHFGQKALGNQQCVLVTRGPAS